MLPSRKIFSAITGILLIALGIICISRPVATLVSIAWLVGLIILISGISTLISWLTLRSFFQQSGSIFFSAVLQIIIGTIFLRHDVALATFLPLIFAFYLIFEGVSLSIRSLDYKKAGYKGWMLNLLSGICSAVLGLLSLGTPAVFSLYLGIGFIINGLVYLTAFFSTRRFEKPINKNPWNDQDVDEQ